MMDSPGPGPGPRVVRQSRVQILILCSVTGDVNKQTNKQTESQAKQLKESEKKKRNVMELRDLEQASQVWHKQNYFLYTSLPLTKWKR